MRETAATEATANEQQENDSAAENHVGDQKKDIHASTAVANTETPPEADEVVAQNDEKQPAKPKKDTHPLHELAKRFLYRTDDMWEAFVVGRNAAITERDNKQKEYNEKIKPYIIKSDEKTFSINLPSDIRKKLNLLML